MTRIVGIHLNISNLCSVVSKILEGDTGTGVFVVVQDAILKDHPSNHRKSVMLWWGTYIALHNIGFNVVIRLTK